MLKSRIFIIIAVAFLIFCFVGNARAEFTVTEILVIPWGDGPNELEIWEPGREYSDDIEPDTVGFMVPSGGPRKTFVDRDENVYFSSIDISYFKGFDINGRVIVDYSAGKTEFHDEFFRGMFRGFYVDSLGRIYCNGNEMAGAYVAVADKNDNLLDMLNPLGPNSGKSCSVFLWGSDDILIFSLEDHGLYTYMNGQFYPGGSLGWRAADGVTYWGMPASTSQIYLFRYSDPDTTGCAAVVDTSYISFEFNNLESGGVLGVDDNLNIYISFSDSTGTNKGVRVYDQSLKLIDQFQYLPRQQNIYLWHTRHPFFRHDGNVYEFHCRDDGMHVFRWSRK